MNYVMPSKCSVDNSGFYFTNNINLLYWWHRIWILPRRGVLNTTLCDKVCQWLATGRWFSPGTPVPSTNKTDCHNIAEILLKGVLNTITLTLFYNKHKLVVWMAQNAHSYCEHVNSNINIFYRLYWRVWEVQATPVTLL